MIGKIEAVPGYRNYYLGLGERPDFEKRLLVQKKNEHEAQTLNADKKRDVSRVDIPSIEEPPLSLQAQSLKEKEEAKKEAERRGTTLDFLQQQGNNMLAFHAMKKPKEETKTIIREQTA